MKKSGSKSFEDFPSTLLYLDDLKDILSVLSTNCAEVRLRTGDYDNVAPEELDELVSSIKLERFQNIHIQASNPYISIDLQSYVIRVYISEDNVIQRGVISKIREVVERNERRYFEKALTVIGALPLVAFGIFVFMKEYALSAVMFLLSLMMIFPITKYQMNHKVIILTKNKENRIPFLKRKKDELLVALASASAGALISFILIKIFGRP